MTSRGVLSRLTGQPALTTGRAVIGRVVDLTVLLGATHPEVHRVAIGSGRRIRYLVPWPVIRNLDEREVVRMAGQFYKLYLHPKFLAHQLWSVRSLEDLDYAARGVKAIWGHVRDFQEIRRTAS